MGKEYIEREAFDMELQNLVREYNKNCESDKSSGAFEALYRLRLFPAADVVEVVRCKDCKHIEMVIDLIGDPHYFCANVDAMYTKHIDLDDYCSNGERKEV